MNNDQEECDNKRQEPAQVCTMWGYDISRQVQPFYSPHSASQDLITSPEIDMIHLPTCFCPNNSCCSITCRNRKQKTSSLSDLWVYPTVQYFNNLLQPPKEVARHHHRVRTAFNLDLQVRTYLSWPVFHQSVKITCEDLCPAGWHNQQFDVFKLWMWSCLHACRGWGWPSWQDQRQSCDIFCTKCHPEQSVTAHKFSHYKCFWSNSFGNWNTQLLSRNGRKNLIS